jgi:hypothetical protein
LNVTRRKRMRLEGGASSGIAAFVTYRWSGLWVFTPSPSHNGRRYGVPFSIALGVTKKIYMSFGSRPEMRTTTCRIWGGPVIAAIVRKEY